MRPRRRGPTTDVVEILVRPGIQVTSCICEVCSAQVSELRRGRCWGCYARWVDDRPVGMGAKCTTCNEKRRRFLKSVELFGAWKPMCFNCAGQLLDLDPMPPTRGLSPGAGLACAQRIAVIRSFARQLGEH